MLLKVEEVHDEHVQTVSSEIANHSHDHAGSPEVLVAFPIVHEKLIEDEVHKLSVFFYKLVLILLEKFKVLIRFISKMNFQK